MITKRMLEWFRNDKGFWVMIFFVVMLLLYVSIGVARSRMGLNTTSPITYIDWWIKLWDHRFSQ